MSRCARRAAHSDVRPPRRGRRAVVRAGFVARLLLVLVLASAGGHRATGTSAELSPDARHGAALTAAAFPEMLAAATKPPTVAARGELDKVGTGRSADRWPVANVASASLAVLPQAGARVSPAEATSTANAVSLTPSTRAPPYRSHA